MRIRDPWTGEFPTTRDYSPAMLVFVGFAGGLGLLSAAARGGGADA